jgi:hypothetical protein
LSTLLARVIWSVVFGGAGVFLAWVTLKSIQRRRQWLASSVVIEGEVIALKERTRAASRVAGITAFAPVVEYGVPGSPGTVKRFTSREASVPCPYTVGQRVPVRYLAGDRAEAELDAAIRGWTMILATGALALACLVAAITPIVIAAQEAVHR